MPSPSESVGDVVTVVTAVAVLSLVSGSVSFPMTIVVLLTPPAAVGATTIVTVVLAPLVKSPRLQVTVLVPLQVPWLGVAETKLTPGGKVSVITTPVAASGPLFMTVMV